MKKVNISKLLAATAQFEHLVSFGGEVSDSGIVATTVNGVAVPVLNGMAPAFGKAVQDAANKAANAGRTLAGNFNINGYAFNARSVGGKWQVVNSKLNISGSLLQDPDAGPALQRLLTAASQKIAAGVQKSLNTQAGQLNGDTITNHETVIQFPSIDI